MLRSPLTARAKSGCCKKADSREGVSDRNPTPNDRIKSASFCGDSSSSSRGSTTVRPSSMAAALSNTNASNPTLHTESTAPAPYTACMACDRFKRLQRLISTPFGTPVLPEV